MEDSCVHLVVNFFLSFTFVAKPMCICSGCERPARNLGVPGRSGNRFRQCSSLIGDGYQYGILVTGSSGFARMEDTAASGYYQNTISRLDGHDLLSQK